MKFDEVHFYSPADQYGGFSNSADYPVTIAGRAWPTAEHYFQAQKFDDKKYQDRIRAAPSPEEAARLGRNRLQSLRRAWDTQRLIVMRRVVLEKFQQHPDLAALLLSTGEGRLVECSEQDAFWGDGGDGKGKNWLGRILKETRNILRDAQDESD